MTLKRFERHQQVLRRALERLGALRLSGELDEYFFTEWRAALLAAGATDADIELNVAFMASVVARATHDAARCQEQLELISEHLACADMDVHLGKDGTVKRVVFPTRPSIH
jgi:hypothetical protein